MKLAIPAILLALTCAHGNARNGAPLAPAAVKKEIQEKKRQTSEAKGCEDYRADFDMYAVCKKRGLPARRTSHGGFAYRPMDQEIARAVLPPECRGFDGQPTWNGAPEVIEWTYCDNLNSGCEYYLFVQRFTSLDDLRLKDTLTAREKVQAFIQACREETFGGSHQLAYTGTYPLMAHDFLDVLFGTQTAVRPKDAFGFDGMRRQGLALAPPPPFRLESFLLDMSLAPVVRKLNSVVQEFETFRGRVAGQRDALFLKTFDELHAKGVLSDHKTSNQAAADALKQALAIYPEGDPQRERFENIELRLRAALREFDSTVDRAVKTLSRPRPAGELVYHPGDNLFLFLKGTGSPTPRLRMTLRIRRLAGLSETRARIEQPLGVLTRAFDDPPEINRQQNIIFADGYQQYWISLFTQPILIADAASIPGAESGVVENWAVVSNVPGDYAATIELFDETTQASTKTELEFSVVAGEAGRQHQVVR